MDYGVAVGVGRVFDDAAALHDEGDVFHYGDVGEGIALDGDDVGVAAGLKGADVFVFFEHGGSVDGGGLRAPSGVIPPRTRAPNSSRRIRRRRRRQRRRRCGCDGESQFECGTLCGHDLDAFGIGVRIAALAEAGFHVVLKAVEGGDEPGAVLLHELRAFFVEHGAVFDGVDAGADCGLDADGAFSVGHDLLSGAVGNVDGGGHLGFAQVLDVVVGDGIHYAAGGHELDPVCSVFNVAADDVGDVVDGVGDVLTAGEPDVWREWRAVTVASGERDAAACSGDARAEDDSAFDGVAESELRVVGRTFACIAEGGESVIEPEAEIVCAP